MAGELHEPREALSEKSLDIKRAIDSMMEELEAVDWYRQRAQGARNPELREILDHHQREEVEHFAMLLEWVRRHDPDFDEQLRTYLFGEGNVLQAEETATGSAAEGEEPAPPASVEPARRESLRRTIGGMKEGS